MKAHEPVQAAPGAARNMKTGPARAARPVGVDPILALAAAPYRWDYFHALRCIDAFHAGKPRLGTARRPADEAVRLGQPADLSFAPAAISNVALHAQGGVPRIDVRFFGLFGPNGPLPLHLTAYARERSLHKGDHALQRFADLFHHRLLLLFYRAWAQAVLRDAAHLWGKTVWQTEEIIKKAHQDPQTRVASIGRAGENGVFYACIINDLHRAAGRSGVGTVMGSKNLKAVAVRGTKGAGAIKDARAFMQAVAAGKKVLADNAVTGHLQGLGIIVSRPTFDDHPP